MGVVKELNILVVYTTQLEPSTGGSYWFYRQLVDYLNEVGIKSDLFFAYLKKINSLEKKGYKGILLPDREKFNTPLNIKTLSAYIRENQINIVFNMMHATKELNLFWSKIRCLKGVYLFNLIHSKPDFVVSWKKYYLKHLSLSNAPSLKIFIQKICYNLYIPLLRLLVMYIARVSYEIHDLTIVLSDSYIEEYKKVIHKISCDKLFAIPNPIQSLYSKIQIENKNKQIIFVGRISKEKVLSHLLMIWNVLYRKYPDWNLLIVGDGDERASNEILMKSLNLERISFIGYQNNPIPFMDSSAICCLVSVFEGLPTVLFEAMSLGVVPVSFDSYAAVYDIIDDDINGCIVKAYDLKEYARKLDVLMSNPQKRYLLAANAQIKVQQYSIENIGDLWINAFKQLKIIK